MISFRLVFFTTLAVNVWTKHLAVSRVAVLKNNGSVMDEYTLKPYITNTKNAINDIFCCIRLKKYKNIEDTTTTERIIEQFTQILQKPTESNETGYVGLLAIPAVLLATVLIPIVYVSCKKTPQQKPLPNTTVPTPEPCYGNRMLQNNPNEEILPENDHNIYDAIS